MALMFSKFLHLVDKSFVLFKLSVRASRRNCSLTARLSFQLTLVRHFGHEATLLSIVPTRFGRERHFESFRLLSTLVALRQNVRQRQL